MLDKRDPKRFWFFSSALVCLGVLIIATRGKLGLYVHPRYHVFTAALAGIGFALTAWAACTYRYKNKQTVIEYESYAELFLTFGKWLLQKGSWMIVVLAALLLWSPSAPLLSTAAQKKAVVNRKIDEETIAQASWFENPQSLFELSEVLLTKEGTEQSIGKTFTLSGFISESTESNPDILRLSRFVMTCCTVDATPSSIMVFAENWRENYSVDEWISVHGTIERSNIGGRQMTLLRPTQIKKIDQPAEPYDFYTF